MSTIAAARLLSSTLASVDLEATTFDPFGGAVPPAPTPAPVVAAAPTPAPPPVVPPALTYRFLGRMIDPSGQQQIYLSHGDSNIVAAVGTALDDGYVIDSVTDDAIALHHPPTDTHVLLPIPPAGDSALR